MSYTLEKEWYGYFEQLNEAEKKSIISLIKTFLKRQNEGAGDSITIDQYNEEIDESLEQATAGNYITQEEMEKKASKW
jgi:predicted transcriptional regulator